MARCNYVAAKNARPWDRMTGETSLAYGAFISYKELSRQDRSHSRLASDMNKAHTVISEWSVKWGWQDRIAAWENELELEKERAARKEAQQAGVRQAAHLHAITRVLALPVEELVKRIARQEVDLKDLSTVDLFSLSILSARAYPRVALAERLVRGQATEIISHTGEVAQPEWSREDVAAFWGAAQQAGLSPEDFRPRAIEAAEEEPATEPPAEV